MNRLCAVLLIISAYFVSAQEILWKVTDTAELFDGNFKFVRNIGKNTVVQGEDTIVFSKTGDMDCDYVTSIIFENECYSIDAEKVIPLNAKDLIDERLLTAHLARNGKHWFVSYSIHITKAGSSDVALQFEPRTLAFVDKYSEGHWYQDAYFGSSMSLFNTSIRMLGIQTLASFFITSIEKVSGYYKLSVVCEEFDNADTHLPVSIIPREGEKTSLLLIPDGEYIDVFVGSVRNYLWSFVQVDDRFIRAYEKIIRSAPSSLNIKNEIANITWPKRANKKHRIGRSCVVVESLRLRNQESTASQTLMTMQPGTTVNIIAIGKEQTIDNITANWVKVQLDDGAEGWCFGGWLVDITR